MFRATRVKGVYVLILRFTSGFNVFRNLQNVSLTGVWVKYKLKKKKHIFCHIAFYNSQLFEKTVTF